MPCLLVDHASPVLVGFSIAKIQAVPCLFLEAAKDNELLYTAAEKRNLNQYQSEIRMHKYLFHFAFWLYIKIEYSRKSFWISHHS